MAYILIVNDYLDFSMGVANALRAEGHEVQIETDEEQAVARMETRRPDLLILDVMFPENEQAGFALARAMHHHQKSLKEVPILMLTAVNSRLRLGFSPRDIDDRWLPVSDFAEEPIDINALREKVSTLLHPVDK